MDCRTQLASLAIEELDKGDFLMATKILTTGIKLEPNNHELYFERSICHHKLGNYQASLDDADSAIRLNASDYNIHYQKGLALIGLSMFSDAVVSFKKAIELRAKQEDSKLSDIFKLLRDATNELNSARRRPAGATAATQQTTTVTAATTYNNNTAAATRNDITPISNNNPTSTVITTTTTIGKGPSNEPVDSTTDRLNSKAAGHNASLDSSIIIENSNNNLVATNRNDQPTTVINSHHQNDNNLNHNHHHQQQHHFNHHPHLLQHHHHHLHENSTVIGNTASNRVSSSASHFKDYNNKMNNNVSPDISSANISNSSPNDIHLTHNEQQQPNHHDQNYQHHHHQQQQQQLHQQMINNDQSSKSGNFEWNIRRSERIFLHNTNEPGTSGIQFNLMATSNNKQHSNTNINNHHHHVTSHQSGSNNPSRAATHKTTTSNSAASISSGKSGSAKHHHESQPNRNSNLKSKDNVTQNSHADSEDIDVDDTCYNSNNNHQSYAQQQMSVEPSEATESRKRVMVAPSSSMPATTSLAISGGQGPSSAPKDDSYSSKYKRLRRDRERARRGTSKLCTIKLSDLDELHKAVSGDHANSNKRSMRVIAPIDGWLYSGKLSLDHNMCTADNANPPQYVVKLDGDTTGSSYLFTQDTVLNDVIKEVRVKSVSELRKGARICCYWSRTYKCLSTGVVTSRTFEATKSLVSVKYDNGDLSALPLEDLRLLPPDYPKYMSNCDPLLLARNSEGVQSSYSDSMQTGQNGTKIIVEPPKSISAVTDDNNHVANVGGESVIISPESNSHQPSLAEKEEVDEVVLETVEKIHRDYDQDMESSTTQENNLEDDTTDGAKNRMIQDHNNGEEEDDDDQVDDDDDDSAIPATNEAIDFITNEVDVDDNHHGGVGGGDNDEIEENRETITKDASALNGNGAAQLMAFDSRASSEENNYGIEYRPWVFEGAPKRNKRHGRTYRDNYMSIRRGNEVIKIGDSAELMPRDESILPFIAKIDGLWATSRGEMRVRVRWYYRLIETEGEPYELKDGENALFETDHFDENDVQSIYRSTRILSWTDYSKDHLGHVNTQTNRPKKFYLAGYYDPVRRIKHLRSDVKEAL